VAGCGIKIIIGALFSTRTASLAVHSAYKRISSWRIFGAAARHRIFLSAGGLFAGGNGENIGVSAATVCWRHQTRRLSASSTS